MDGKMEGCSNDACAYAVSPHWQSTCIHTCWRKNAGQAQRVSKLNLLFVFVQQQQPPVECTESCRGCFNLNCKCQLALPATQVTAACVQHWPRMSRLHMHIDFSSAWLPPKHLLVLVLVQARTTCTTAPSPSFPC
jgi:hypothetical protein